MVADTSEDGNLCAVVLDRTLSVFNTLDNKIIHRVKLGPVTVKVLKISPSKRCISWLQTSPDVVYLSFISPRSGKKIEKLTINELQNEYLLWDPIGQFLAVFSCMSIFINIWEVRDDSSSVVGTISGAKTNSRGRPVAQFSRDGQLFATVNVCNQGHAITIYAVYCSWNCVQRIFSNGCDDVGGMLWCADSASHFVWQSGRLLRLELWTVDGRLEHSLEEQCAHATAVCLSSCGRLAAVLTASGKVRILDLLTWVSSLMIDIVHKPVLRTDTCRSAVIEPHNSKGPIVVCPPILSTYHELKQVSETPRDEPLMQFCPKAQYLATYDPRYPHALWVWSLTSPSALDTIVILSNQTHISGMSWHEHKAYLAVTVTGNRVLVWTPRQATIISQAADCLWPYTAQAYLTSIHHCDTT